MRTNTRKKRTTYEGGKANKGLSPFNELRRTLLACLLWENQFYESGESIAARIRRLARLCPDDKVAALAIGARREMYLRHAPMLLVLDLIERRSPHTEATIAQVISRPDEIAELVSLYWTDGKKPLSAGMKRGLARSFNLFDAYQFAKWEKINSELKIRDVMFLVHPKPKDDEQAAIFKGIAEKTLDVPDTWESRLTAGEDKRAVFTDLLKRGRLGYMALLRNLRNMQQANVSVPLIKEALLKQRAKNVLPFRFIAAAKAAPWAENELDMAMQMALGEFPKLPGKTVLLVDVSASMNQRLSYKSDLTRRDAANALAILMRGVCEDVQIYSFSDHLAAIPPRSGMALGDAITNSQRHHTTRMSEAIERARKDTGPVDRLVVFTDEQSQSVKAPTPYADKFNWMINVASQEKSVAHGPWRSVTGFSEAIVKYIQEAEALDLNCAENCADLS